MKISIKNTPDFIKKPLRPIRNAFIRKHSSELGFWEKKHNEEGGRFNNDFYEEILLGMAQEENRAFIENKVIADFGCGPRGSLFWAKEAKLRLGIDVLMDQYSDSFKEDMIGHQTLYIKSTEKTIPIPSNYVDIIFTLNAIDHVDSFEDMCNEIIRILKPGGIFIGSFNLEEPATPSEPQTLNEKIIKDKLLNKLRIESYRATFKGPKDDEYRPFYDNNLRYESGKEGILWVKAEKQ